MEFPDRSIVEQIEMKMTRPSQFAVRDKFQKMNSEIETLASSIRKHWLSCGPRKNYTLHHFLCDSIK